MISKQSFNLIFGNLSKHQHQKQSILIRVSLNKSFSKRFVSNLVKTKPLFKKSAQYLYVGSLIVGTVVGITVSRYNYVNVVNDENNNLLLTRDNDYQLKRHVIF